MDPNLNDDLKYYLNDFGFPVHILAGQVLGQDKKQLKLIINRNYPPINDDGK
jgi:hypothetical protein